MNAPPAEEMTPAEFLGEGQRRAFGYQLSLQFSGCRTAVLESIDLMSAWCRQLVFEIGMQAYGAPIVDEFGEGDRLGVTAVQRMVIQRLTTSAIVLHADPPDGLFVDVFSCKWFPGQIVTTSACRFFGATAGTGGPLVTRQTPPPDSGWRFDF